MLFCSVINLICFSNSFFFTANLSTLFSYCLINLSTYYLMTTCDFLIVFTLWSLCFPCITHSGQIHSHLQSKQKYSNSSSPCSGQFFFIGSAEYASMLVLDLVLLLLLLLKAVLSLNSQGCTCCTGTSRSPSMWCHPAHLLSRTWYSPGTCHSFAHRSLMLMEVVMV
jgi:hypothetical protein